MINKMLALGVFILLFIGLVLGWELCVELCGKRLECLEDRNAISEAC